MKSKILIKTRMKNVKNVKKSKNIKKSKMENIKKSKKKANFLKRNKKYSKIIRGGGNNEFDAICYFKDPTNKEKSVLQCEVTVKPKSSSAKSTSTPLDISTNYSSLEDLLKKLDTKTNIKNIYVFDFNDTLIMYEDNPANKKFPVFINANDEMIDKSKYLITEDDKPLKIDEMGFIFDNIKNNNGDITLQKMSVEKINKKSIQYNLESDMVDTTQQMLKDIQKNSNNIIIILSDSFQKFIRFFCSKMYFI